MLDLMEEGEQRKDVVVYVEEGLEDLPSSLVDLPSTSHIRTLYLFNNLLTLIPSSISCLTNLRELDVSHNRISSLHDNLSLLPHLQTLNLNDNQLPSFPLLLTRIPSLQTLQISSNNLTLIPAEISLLTNLSSLELRYNQIGKLPITMTKMTNLTNLNLFNNSLSAFPDMVLQMPGLLNLELRNNPIPSVPSRIVISTFALSFFLSFLISTFLFTILISLLFHIHIIFFDICKSYLPTTRVGASVPHRVLEGLFIGDYATATNIASLKTSKISFSFLFFSSSLLFPLPFHQIIVNIFFDSFNITHILTVMNSFEPSPFPTV